jgi:hypothetical protein
LPFLTGWPLSAASLMLTLTSSARSNDDQRVNVPGTVFNAVLNCPQEV